MLVADAGADDAPQLTRLINAAYRPTDTAAAGWTDEQDLLDGARIDDAAVLAQMQRGRFLLLRDGAHGPILACAHLAAEPDGACYVSLIAVDPAHQATGLGAAILEQVQHQAARSACPRLRISVITQRAALIGWYERRGFVRTGATLPFPYGNPAVGRPLRDDLSLVVMEKPIPPDRG